MSTKEKTKVKMNASKATDNNYSEKKSRNHGKRNPRPSNRYRKPDNANATKFTGKCEGLRGHVFDCRTVQDAATYHVVLQEVAEFGRRTYEGGGDIYRTILSDNEYQIPQPDDLPDTATATQTEIWKQRIKLYVERCSLLDDNLIKMYSIVLGQCTPLLRGKLETSKNWKALEEQQDVLGLVKAIKSIMFGYDEHKHPLVALYELNRRFYMMVQGPNQSDSSYREQFRAAVEVIEEHGGNFGIDINGSLVDLKLEDDGVPVAEASMKQRKEAYLKVRNEYLATAFQCSARRSKSINR